MTKLRSKILIAILGTAAIVTSPAVAQTTPPLQSCCDPALATMDLRTMFSLDLLPGGNLTSNYGVNFTPTAAYQTALDNTAFMAAVMGGISTAPGSMNWLAVEVEMRTDNVAGNTVWPIPYAPNWGTPVAGIWGNSSILAYNQVPANTATGWQSPHTVAWTNSLSPTHMRPDGRRYQMRFTYWLYSFKNKVMSKRPVICSNVREQYIGVRVNQAAGAPKPPVLDMTTAAAPISGPNSSKSLGAEVFLTPAQVSALPAEIRGNKR